MQINEFVGRGIAALAGAVLALPVLAAGAADDFNLEEVVVTAQKRTERLQDVPVAITVVGAEQLASQHIYSINDLSKTTPALEMVQAFGGPGGGGQIRGIGTTSFTRSAEGAVGIVVDGVSQGNVNISNLFDVQRVEVLRGPQGTLFGLTSSAGVINMVTVAPSFEKFEAKAHIDYSHQGTAGSKFGQEKLSAVFNTPINGTSALRFSVTGDRLIGVQRDTNAKQDNVANEYGLRVRYRLQPSDRFELNLIADYGRRNQNYADPQFTYISARPALTALLAACGIVPGYENNGRCIGQKNNAHTKNYGFSAQFDVGVGANTLTSITGYRKTTQDPNDNDIMGLATEPTQIFNTGATSSGRILSEELRIASPANARLEYVAGVYFSDYKAESGRAPGGAFMLTVRLPFPPFPVINPVRTTDFTETSNKSQAVFGQATYHVNDRLGLIAGLRYTNQDIKDQDSGNINAPPPVPTFGSLSKSNVSGRLGLQYKFDPSLTGYATIVRGYKGPQVSPAAQGTPATIINAEIPTAYELGVKGATLDGKLGIDANVFLTQVHDYQGQRCGINPVGVLVCTPQTVPTVDTKGVEVDLYGQPVKGLSLNGGVIYNIAEYPNGWTGYDPENLSGGTTSLSGEQIVGVPKTKLTLNADYSRPLGGLEGYVGGDVVYKSAMRLGPSGDPRFVYKAHWVTGLRFGVRAADGRWSAGIYARNLNNDHEPVTIFGGPSFTGPGSDPAQPAGYVNGISGWVTAASFRQVGLSFDLKY